MLIFLVRHIFRDEKRYYERIVAYSRERLMLFPYHLADMIVKGLRITPFNYYISVVERLIQAEKSYDTLPNFTAADCKFEAFYNKIILASYVLRLKSNSESTRKSLINKLLFKGIFEALGGKIAYFEIYADF